MKNIKENKKIILLTIPLIILTLLVIGVTYAYYGIESTGESASTMIIGGANITANYTITNEISIAGALPSNNVIAYKDFTVTYTNTSNEDYKIYLKAEIDYNSFTDVENDGVLYYDIYSGSSHNTLVQAKKQFPAISNGKEVLYEIPIPANSTNTTSYYRINFYFPESATKFQNKNGDLAFKGNIVIEETTASTYTRSFANDSWDTIAGIAQYGDPTVYPIGSEKEVNIGGTNYTVRVANNTTPSECNDENFSQTACGLVIEFVDIVEKRQLHNDQNNVGSWPATTLHSYANGDFFNKLPVDLQNVIIDTKVISGHGPTSGETNFTSKDKIYLLSAHEVYEDGTTNKVSTSDTSYNNTRQLDYYKSKNVTGDNYSSAIKSYLGTNDAWWLRTPISYNPQIYFLTTKEGNNSYTTPIANSIGFAPAFRVGITITPFAEDTWETIAKNVEVGNASKYKVGDEKEVLIRGKYYRVRVANNSTPDECSDENFSQTACGFVVEFVDNIESYAMNSTATNVGGWPGSSMRTYTNVSLFNNLPSDLQNVIIDTKVISGHGSTSGETNFTSIDRIYLLSLTEVYGNSVSSTADSAYDNTRQLDYYVSKNTNSASYNTVYKSNSLYERGWWLRTPLINSNTSFFSSGNTPNFSITDAHSSISNYTASYGLGLAPAFRIGIPKISFSENSWYKIASIVKSGNLTAYPVGAEKKVQIAGNNYTVRVANNTNPTECNSATFSQTACGFVVEFVDIVEQRAMNSTATITNGWPGSTLRTYANGEFFKKLPSDLQSIISPIKVVSEGITSSGTQKYNSTDKIYLLNFYEIMSFTTSDYTRRLDYYASKQNGTSSSNSELIKYNIKEYNGITSPWLTRNPSKSNTLNKYYAVAKTGLSSEVIANTESGFAPAFRIR